MQVTPGSQRVNGVVVRQGSTAKIKLHHSFAVAVSYHHNYITLTNKLSFLYIFQVSLCLHAASPRCRMSV